MGWEYEVTELSEGIVATVYDGKSRMVADHLSEEHARMIAAAPEMAAALAPFSAYAGALFTRNRNASEVAFSIVTHDGKHIDIKVGDFFAARSALAKAEAAP